MTIQIELIDDEIEVLLELLPCIPLSSATIKHRDDAKNIIRKINEAKENSHVHKT